MSSPQPSTLTQRQLTRIALFQSVRAVNGQKIYKNLCESIEVLSYAQALSEIELSLSRYFIYVLEGEIDLRRVGSEGRQEQLGHFGKGEYCGLKDYYLEWGESLCAGVAQNTRLVAISLGSFYRYFRRVLPVSFQQARADFIRKISFFRHLESDKVFKLACLSQRYRIKRDRMLIREGAEITHIFLIISGRLHLKSSLIREPIYCGSNEDFLMKELMQGLDFCYFSARCVADADILAIPKDEVSRVLGISTKGVRKFSEKEDFSVEGSQNLAHILDESNEKILRIKRPRSMYSSTKCRDHSKSKTEKSERNEQMRHLGFDRVKSAHRPHSSEGATTPHRKEHHSLGQMQLLKFMKRKEKAETRSFSRYVQSRAPEIVYNPSKQFALVKPIHITPSQYVRNMKRKLKQSISLHNSTNLRPGYDQFLL